MKNENRKWAGRGAGTLALCLVLLGTLAPLAQAAILFQDDTFMTVDSDNIMIDANNSNPTGDKQVQFGNSGTDGVLNWVQLTTKFSLSNSLDVTGGITANTVVDLGGTNGLTGNSPAASRNLLRKNSSPNTAITGAACSALGEVIINTTANRLEVCTTLGAAGTAVWSAPTVTLPQGNPNPTACTAGDLFYNTSTNTLNVCTTTGNPGTWNIAGPQDFEAVYNYDSDKTLTTGGNAFTINTGVGAFTLTSTGTTGINGSATTLKGSGAGAGAVTLDANDNAAGGITGVWGTGGLNFSGPGGGLTYGATGAYNMSGTGASTLTTSTGQLNLSTTVSGDVAVSAAKDITFDDAQLLSAVKMTNTATGWAGTLTGGGIIDNINSFTTYTAGEGASNVGVQDGTLINIFGGTGASSNNLQQALSNINNLVGPGAPNNSILTWYPEYPDTVINKDGTNNNGTLTSDFDTEHYYRWTTTQTAALNDIDLKFRYSLPADFASTGNFTFKYRTQDAVATNDKVDVTVYNVTDSSSCGSALTNNGIAWATATITAATLNGGCAGLSAGDTMEIQVKLYSMKSAGVEHWSQIGVINHLYNN
jgi:hypothetical protein